MRAQLHLPVQSGFRLWKKELERERERRNRPECLILQSKPEKLNRREFERHRLNKSHLLPKTRLVPDFAQTPVLLSRQMWTRQTAWVDRPCTMQHKQGRWQLWTSCWLSVAFMLTQPQQKPALPPFMLRLRLGCLKNNIFLQSSGVRYCFWKLCNIGKGLQLNKTGQPNDGSCKCVVYFQHFCFLYCCLYFFTSFWAC